jgi:hypothetical protein
VNVLVQPEKASLLVMAMAFFSYRLVNTWNSNSAPRLSSAMSQLVKQQKIHLPVAVDGLGETAVDGRA